MARAYHNCEGLMRDLRALLDDGDERAYQFAELLIELDELVQPDDDDARLEAAAEGPVQRGQIDLDLRDHGDGSELEPSPPGHDPVCRPHVDGVRGVVTPALGHRRATAASNAASQSDGGAPPVVRTTLELSPRKRRRT